MASNSIRVTINPQVFEIQPGGTPIEAAVAMQNLGAVVDQYSIHVDGLPATWYTLSSVSVALFPGDTADAKLAVRPPRDARAGTHPFGVVVTSLADESQTSRAEATLTIRAAGTWTVDVTPRKVIGRSARYRVTLRNGLNAQIAVNLEAADASGAARCAFSQAAVQLAPQETKVVELRVTVPRSGLLGQPKNYDIRLKAEAAQGDVKSFPLEFVHRPRFASLAPLKRLFVPLVLLLLILSAVTVKDVNSRLNQGLANLRQGRCGAHATTPVLCSGTIPLLTGKAGPSSTGEQTQHHGYIGGLRTFHAAHPDLVGDPLTDEHPFTTDPNASTNLQVQETTKGLLFYDRDLGRAYFVPDGTELYEFDHGHMQVFKDGKTQPAP
jgi:hypothetical protein